MLHEHPGHGHKPSRRSTSDLKTCKVMLIRSCFPITNNYRGFAGPPVDAERSTWEVITGTNEGVHRVLIVIHRHQRWSKILKIKGLPGNSFPTLNHKRHKFN